MGVPGQNESGLNRSMQILEDMSNLNISYVHGENTEGLYAVICKTIENT